MTVSTPEAVGRMWREAEAEEPEERVSDDSAQGPRGSAGAAEAVRCRRLQASAVVGAAAVTGTASTCNEELSAAVAGESVAAGCPLKTTPCAVWCAESSVFQGLSLFVPKDGVDLFVCLFRFWRIFPNNSGFGSRRPWTLSLLSLGPGLGDHSLCFIVA